jgi:hypothetical protein
VTWAEHGGDRFVAAVENGPLSATQFHPEKSGDAGARLLRNWVGAARGQAPRMSKEARRRREASEREAGIVAAARGAEAETARAPDSQRAVTSRLPGGARRRPACSPHGAGGRRCHRGDAVGLNVLVWVVFPDWALRAMVLLVSLLAALSCTRCCSDADEPREDSHMSDHLELLPAVDIAGGQAVQLVQGVAGRRSGSATRSRPRCAGRRRAPSGSTSSTSTPPSGAATTATCSRRSSAPSTSTWR